MVTVGKNSNGRPICKPLKPESYFATYNDAYAALVEYNKNPYDLNPSITMEELYSQWAKEHFSRISDESSRAISSAWKYCSSIYKMRVVDVRARHIKGCIEDGTAIIRGKNVTPSAVTKNRIKSIFNQMLDYAVEFELVDRNYSRMFNLSEEIIKEVHKTQKEHLLFSKEEMDLLWANVNMKQYVDVIIIQCYSGWRPQELGLIKLSDIDLEKNIFIGGIKTDSGTNRIVPIHSKIKPLVEKKYQEAKELGSDFLFNYTNVRRKNKNTQLTYTRYTYVFNIIRDELCLNPAHRPHDARKHFITMAKKYGVDDYAIKYIVGHKISDITEKVYTEREFKWLREEIEKIK